MAVGSDGHHNTSIAVLLISHLLNIVTLLIFEIAIKLRSSDVCTTPYSSRHVQCQQAKFHSFVLNHDTQAFVQYKRPVSLCT